MTPLFSDNLAVVVMARWCLRATMFNGDQMAGPVPTFFSEDPEAALEGVRVNPLKGHWDLMRIQKLFLMPESILIGDAKNYVKKPR